MGLSADGFETFPYDDGIARWARTAAATVAGLAATRDPAQRRHGGTWLVGLDLLPNDAAGAVAGVPLPGAWRGRVPDLPLHRAQVSIVHPGYPRRDAEETAGQHRYRLTRHAAHVDGLLPLGPDRRRHALEHHAYILALPLNGVAAAPTVVWPGSHRIMGDALRAAIGTAPVREVDLTEAYQAARRSVFEMTDPVPLPARAGCCTLIHRFALHGTAPWPDCFEADAPEGRMIAFFRPEIPARDWLAAD